MATLHQITEQAGFDKVWEDSTNGPVLVFKNSITCPISAEAFKQFKSYVNDAKDDAYYLVVSEVRDVSNQIAETTGVRHQSPQIFLINNKEVVWNESHSKITEESIKEAVAAL